MAQTMSFGYDGDGGLGDRLLAAALHGDKTATSSLAVEYLSGDPLPRVGERVTLVEHHGRPHGMVETTRVRIIPLHLVGDDVAWDEGQGFADAADWRRAHVSFWDEVAGLVRADAGDAAWQLREAEPVVVQWFHLLEPPQHASGVWFLSERGRPRVQLGSGCGAAGRGGADMARSAQRSLPLPGSRLARMGSRWRGMTSRWMAGGARA